MIRINFDEPETDDWRSWRHDCEEATEALLREVARGDKPEITDLYKDDRMKSLYKDPHGPFSGKCAYCESLIAVNHPGDIEHFRPKSKVTDLNCETVVIPADNGDEKPHPGYYWLAYEWRNLLFSCIDCNRPSKQKTGGVLVGKWDRFPVRTHHAVNPEGIDDEEPLLINPLLEDPSEHLKIDRKGIAIPMTERGETCIKVFGLNLREALVEDRRKTYTRVRDQVMQLANSLHSDSPDVEERMADLAAVKDAKEAYSAVGELALREQRKLFGVLISKLGGED